MFARAKLRSWLLGLVGASAGICALVSCAESDQPVSLEETPDAQPIPPPPDADVPHDADVPPDADCDADPLLCTPAPTPCEGVDWCPVTTPLDPRRALTAVWGSSKNDVWAVGSSGAILHYDGATWTAVPSGTTRTLLSVAGAGPDEVWIVSTFGTVLRGSSTGGTATVTPWPMAAYSGASENLLLSTWAASTDDVWIAGESARLAGTTATTTTWRKKTAADGGVGWEAMTACTSCTSLAAVWGSSPSDVWVAGAGGKTVHTSNARPLADDAGAGPPVWTTVPSNTKQDLLALWGSSADDVWAVGRRGTILHYVQGASSWELVESPTTQDLQHVWGSGPDDVWAVGEYGTILHYDGAAWTASTASFAAGVKPHLYGVWGSSKDDVWIVGEGIVLSPAASAKGAGK